MRKMLKYFLCITFMSYVTMGAVTPYYSIRSQSENSARELVGAGWNTQINLCDMNEWYANFAVTAEYTRSFKPYNIAETLFGCQSNGCTPCLTDCNSCTPCGPCYDSNDCYRIGISGSNVENRNACDWLADYFGLPIDYQSYVTVEPRIENFLVDLNFYIGLDEWCKGMYFRIHAPIVRTRWDLNLRECIQNSGETAHPLEYFNKTVNGPVGDLYGIAQSDLVTDFRSFINGCGIINSSDITFNPLCYAKMDMCERKKTALSDIQMALGWNIWCDCNYHVGLNIRAVAPTGNRPLGNYLFEPIIGNGKHWELGAGFTSHWNFWENECNNAYATFFLDINVSHLFKSQQCRTFDLCGKPLSRYMLASKFKTPVEDLTAGDTLANGIEPNKQFAGIYSPVANLTHMPVDVSVGIQSDLTFMLQYIRCNWSLDLGYSFWQRNCEKIECSCDCCPCFDENTWALKGDSYMYGFKESGARPDGDALSASQSEATICTGKNKQTDPILWYKNPGIDNPKPSWDGTEALFTFDLAEENQTQVYTSLNPVFINFCDIDFCGARTKGRSHKLFAHIDYTWCDKECWTPYLGLGFEAEFGQKPCDDCCNNNYSDCCTPCQTSCTNYCDNNCCNDCCNICALSQWGIWLKGGLAFN